jgi:hypothetical protein
VSNGISVASKLRAERTGSTAEATILGTLRGRGYAECAAGERSVAQPPLFGDGAPGPSMAKTVVRQCPVGVSIYGTPLAADFIIYGAAPFPHGLAIESKWQHAQGSVDEKLPYLVLNIREGYRVPAVIVADGGGHRPEALRWLRDQVDGAHLVGVFSLVEFLTWANRAL